MTELRQRGDDVDFSVLGHVELTVPGGPVALGGRRQRVVLACLLNDPNRTVSIEALVDAVWADDPPATARNQVKNAIWQLRRTLDSAGEPGRIEATPTGYSIRVASDELDRVRFERLAEQAVDADDATAAVLLREALAAWSEPVAFADLPDAPALRIASQGLAEQRLTAIERLMAAELSRGRHAEVVEELAGHAAANPTRERLAELHMRALYLCDRQADALAVYANTRRHLVDELGVEPGPGLRRMHETVLAGEPVAQSAPAIALPRPAQLPAAHGGFVGRAVELSRICGWISTTTDRPRIIAVTGAPGIGKTALAVEAAHRAAGHFPDGHLYVNLHGYDEQPPPLPIEVLAAFLRALGLPAEALPTTVDAASALYRSTLADRRMLVVLDNAANAESVRPLLPGTPGCAVVVTSRDRLAGLVAREGAQLIGLEPLPGAEATELLRQAAGPDRVDAEPDAAAELVRRCGQLPLALRIVAANLATNPLVRLSEHVRELEAAGLHGLAAGEDADTTVLHAFGTSYGVLDAGTQRLFRRVGLTPGRSFTVPAAAAAADVSPAEAERAVRRLATAHMVGACGMGGYTFHDLLRQYARQLAGSDDSAAEREQATALLFDWYRYAMNAAAALIAPRSLRLPAREPLRPWPLPFTDGSSAREWFDLEVPNLLAVTRQAAESGPRSVAWEIMAAVPAVCWRSPRIVEMLQVCGLARQAAVQSGQLDAAAVIRRSEGIASRLLGRVDEAERTLQQALREARQAGWAAAEVMALSDLGVVYQVRGDQQASVDHLDAALRVARRSGDAERLSTVILNLGYVNVRRGDIRAARTNNLEALELIRTAGDETSVGTRLLNLGYCQHLLGELAESERLLHDALEHFRSTGDWHSVAAAHVGLALLYADWNRPEQAREHADASLLDADGNPHPKLRTEGLYALGEVLRVSGETAAAIDRYAEAATTAVDHADPFSQTMACRGLAEARRAAGEPDDARLSVTEALEIAVSSAFRLHEGEARRVLAEVLLDQGEVHGAHEEATLARDIHRCTGYRLGEARALSVLARTQPAARDEHRRTAERIYSSVGLRGLCS